MLLTPIQVVRSGKNSVFFTYQYSGTKSDGQEIRASIVGTVDLGGPGVVSDIVNNQLFNLILDAPNKS